MGFAARFLTVLAFSLAGASAAEAAYPERPITLIVPFAAGGTTDIIGRIIASGMAKDLKRQIIVENREGAGGTIGTDQAARARPDGYTLLLHTPSTAAINRYLYTRLKYDSAKDFTPISLVTKAPNVLVVRKGFPAKNVAELVKLAKANPGKYNYASSGNGTILHLSGALFTQTAGVDIVHVPYNGAGPAMNDVVAGTIDIMFDNFPSAIGHIRAGRVIPLAITTKARNFAMPNLPSIAEQGYPSYETSTWAAIYGPKNLPPDILARLAKAAAAAARDPETIKKFRDLGAEPVGSTPQECAAFVAQQIAYWAPVVKNSGARIE